MGGCTLHPERRIGHELGDILRGMTCSSPGFAGFGEAYFTTVLPGKVKGWRRHRVMVLNLIVPTGTVRFVAIEQDGAVPRRFVLGSEAPHARLTIPPGTWFAFQCLGAEPGVVLNLASIEHDPAEAESVPLETFAFDWNSAA